MSDLEAIKKQLLLNFFRFEFDPLNVGSDVFRLMADLQWILKQHLKCAAHAAKWLDDLLAPLSNHERALIDIFER